MKKKVIVLGLVIVLFAGCTKEKQILINSTWKVESMQVHADSVLRMSTDYSYPTLSFIERVKEITFIFSSEFSGMVGNVKVGNNKIDFQDDSPYLIFPEESQFAIDCANLLLNKVNKYDTDGYKLTFKGKKGEVINLIRW
jgi:hypothetical protein